MKPDYVKNELQRATCTISQAIEIIYKIKSIENYVPTHDDMRKFGELQKFLKNICEDFEYIILSMRRRMKGQHEHSYLAELARKSGIYKDD